MNKKTATKQWNNIWIDPVDYFRNYGYGPISYTREVIDKIIYVHRWVHDGTMVLPEAYDVNGNYVGQVTTYTWDEWYVYPENFPPELESSRGDQYVPTQLYNNRGRTGVDMTYRIYCNEYRGLYFERDYSYAYSDDKFTHQTFTQALVSPFEGLSFPPIQQDLTGLTGDGLTNAIEDIAVVVASKAETEEELNYAACVAIVRVKGGNYKDGKFTGDIGEIAYGAAAYLQSIKDESALPLTPFGIPAHGDFTTAVDAVIRTSIDKSSWDGISQPIIEFYK